MKKPRRGAGGNGEIMKYEEIIAAIKDINGPWSNEACMGYCLIAMRRAGLRPTVQRRVLRVLEGLMKERPLTNQRASEMTAAELVGPAVVAAKRGDELIGFAKPVVETICAEWL